MTQNKILEQTELNIINMGLELFKQETERQNIPTLQVNWRPPCGGDPELIRIIDAIRERG